MSVAEHTVFKLVSLRAPVDGLTVDPAEDNPDSEVVRRLDNMDVNPINPEPEVLRLISDQPTLTDSDLDQSLLMQIAYKLRDEAPLTFSELATIRMTHDGAENSLAELSQTGEFSDAYRRLTDSWLTLKLRQSQGSLVNRHAVLIRIAHICLRLDTAPDSLREPGAIARLSEARAVFPRAWRPSLYQHKELQVHHAAELDSAAAPDTSVLAQNIALKKREQKELETRVTIHESIQSKAHAAYWRLKQEHADDESSIVMDTNNAPRVGGLLYNAVDFIFGRPRPGLPPQPSPRMRLDDAFFSALENRLTAEERLEFSNVLASTPAGRPHFLGDLFDVFAPTEAIMDANDACATIRVWEAKETEELPEPSSHKPSKERPSIRAVGWGDLIVARERLVGYVANEVAHIENVLSGEEKARIHHRTRTTEEVVETEVIEETESEKDLQTTDRYELQTESQKTIDQDFSIEAGVNTSGRYGLTKVETSLDAGFQQSQSESRNTSVQLAKDIVSRAVERTFESVRELRRLTITEQIREINRHRIRNIAPEGSNTIPPSLSGIYLWVEKTHELELRHYGTRLMVEFHIPEPAVSLLESKDSEKEKIPKPAPLTIGPSDITQGKYLCLAGLFGAEDVEPPPPNFINVGWAWASAPSEDVDEDTAEDTVADTINVPAGYRPASVTAIVSAHPAHAEHVDVFMAVGGADVINLTGSSYGEKEYEFELKDTWPNGIPVSVRAHGHFDKTLVAQAAIRCERTPEAMTEWRLRTWEKIKAAHQVMVREYEEAVERAGFRESGLFQIPGRPEAENRRIELEELKKWAIKTMRLVPFGFDAVDMVGDFQEIEPLEADFQAPIVRFFEEAFEWRQVSYFLYPYFWGRRDAWKLRQQIDNPDPQHVAFLRSGAARVIAPVTPGYEERVLHYLESDPEVNELSKINGPDKPGEVPADSEHEDLWLELLINKNEELALGSGTLRVRNGSTTVGVNADSDHGWRVSERDIGRELYIDGDRYVIESIIDESSFDLNESYKGTDTDKARYATGSVPYSPPWLVRVPTSLVILKDNAPQL